MRPTRLRRRQHALEAQYSLATHLQKHSAPTERPGFTAHRKRPTTGESIDILDGSLQPLSRGMPLALASRLQH
jgi:hypothetical protein